MADDTTTAAPPQTPDTGPDKVVLPNPPQWLKDYKDPAETPPGDTAPLPTDASPAITPIPGAKVPKYITPLPKPADKLTPARGVCAQSSNSYQADISEIFTA